MITGRTKLFAIVWLAGMAGVLSVLLIDLSAVLANLPAAAGSEMPFNPLLIKLLSIVQSTILLSIAVFIGFQLAHRVGLSAPAAEAQWAAWRIFQRGRGTPRAIFFVSAIVISSVVFGIGHLPLVKALEVDFTLPIVAFIVPVTRCLA